MINEKTVKTDDGKKEWISEKVKGKKEYDNVIYINKRKKLPSSEELRHEIYQKICCLHNLLIKDLPIEMVKDILKAVDFEWYIVNKRSKTYLGYGLWLDTVTWDYTEIKNVNAKVDITLEYKGYAKIGTVYIRE